MANILVIDDDKDIQRLLEFALKRAGHTVELALEGEKGLALAESEEPDLIVCDVMMPKMTGYEFCRRARSKPNLKETPIIVFSARFQPVDKQTALDAGATDYMPKSTAPNALVERIAELLPAAEKKEKTVQGMIGVFSLRGGVGATSLAVNLAIALAISQKTKIALVDMASLGGHAALMLGTRPTSHVNQLLASGQDDFSSDVIQSHLIEHPSGVQLLASAPSYDEQVTGNAVDQLPRLLGSLKSTFALNVLDVPQILEPHISPVLQLVDKLLLVMSADMPSVQSTVVALQGLLKLGLADKKINLIVNQTSQPNALPPKMIQQAVKRPVKAFIPFDANMIKAVNSGKPVILSAPQSPSAKAIGQLAGKLFAQG